MSILTSPPRLTRHLSDHHAVQGEAEYVERHAPEIGQVAPAMAQVRPLEWNELDDGKAFRALLPIIGSVRVEPYGCCDWWEVLWSMPGQCDKLIPDVFNSADEAKAAAQADYERRILAALTPAPGWQPIETAPRDGTVFLALEDGEYYGCARSECGDCWVGYCGQPVVYTLEPTHWMPLPAAPEAEGGCDDL